MPQVDNTADAWLDPQFAPLDTRTGPESLSAALAAAQPEAEPEPELPVAEPEPVAEEPEQDTYPKTIEYENGSSLVIDKTNKGWSAELVAGPGIKPEVFYGKTQAEMWQNLAGAKAHATRKIRDLNRQVKLHSAPETEPVVRKADSLPAVMQIRDLTPDEIFEIRTQLDANPALAFDTLFAKRTGLTFQQLADLLNRTSRDAATGRIAKSELDTEAVAKEFLASHEDDYYPSNQNYVSMVALLAKNKLGRTLTKRNRAELMTQLVESGHWTVENLEDVFEELSQDGLLEAPESPSAEPPDEHEAPAKPAAAPSIAQDSRIVKTVRRPRAGLGIRASETTSVPAREEEKPPSAEELDNLSDEQISQLFAGVRKSRMSARR